MVDVDVVTEAVIPRPVAEVAGYAADPTNAPEWYANIASVEWETAPPVDVGSRIAYTYEVIEFEPEQRLVMRTAEGPFRWDHLHVAVDVGGTHMSLRQPGNAFGLRAVAAPLVVAAMRRANRKDLAALTALLARHP